MWWCCGKTVKDEPGCKYQKHESREDNDEAIVAKAMHDRIKPNHCTCCKSNGHTADACPQDPNPRTKNEIPKEYDRILRLTDQRKLYATTVVQTTHFMKKSVILEKEDSRNTQDNPFKRGIMKFDDFNYNQFNPFVL